MANDYTRFPQAAWDPEIAALVGQETYFLTQTWARLVNLPAPPPGADVECDLVVAAMTACDQEKLKQINGQDGSWLNVLWPLIRLLPGADKPDFKWLQAWPRLAEMLHAALCDLQPGLYMFKTHFMRARPSQVRSSIVPKIDLPKHPAYPGGHAAQAHTAALLLGALFEGSRDQSALPADLVQAGKDVASNRVIAGIHYPSDSDAGRSLAEQYVPLLRANPLFRELMEAAAKDLGLR